MRVVELESRRVRVALRRKITHASHTRSETENVVVRCKLSDGSTGYGEGVPRDYVTGETIDSSLDLLKRSDLAKQLDTDCADFVEAVHLAERLKLAASPEDYSGVIGNPRKWKKILYPLAYRLAGFRQVKLKVGIEGQDDVKRTKTIRRWLGSKIDLRIDANEAWSPGEAAAR